MFVRKHKIIQFIFIACLIINSGKPVLAQQADDVDIVIHFVGLLVSENKSLDNHFDYIEKHWQNNFTPMAIETLSLTQRRSVIIKLINILETKTGQSFGRNTNDWFFWRWNHSQDQHPYYAKFKSLLYGLIDPKFTGYFSQNRTSKIRLDEVRWGGVLQDGIPPLRQPKMIMATEASYLDDDNVIFGIKINGDARAYPKRILAWHEMFIDEIGGTKFAGVYCTLCGAVILYETVLKGKEYHVGTSGFLYRSNKLMYDKATQSLWNTTWGEPVIGPLADKAIRLKRSHLVTTTWGEWKRRHPNTTVLSLNTGYQRDYGEGIAYHNYFSTDKLMFNVPKLDKRLGNKDEILALIFPDVSKQPLAISANFLSKNRVYHDHVKTLKFVVLTDLSGANRVYKTEGQSFVSYDGDKTVTDKNGTQWMQNEESLISSKGETLNRLPAHRAFWFGWYAANNNTRLIY